MHCRERVAKALNHQQPDAIPIDFGSTPVTGMHCSCVAAMHDYYGLEKRLVKVHEPYQMLGLIEEDLKQAIGIDVEGIAPRNTIFGFPNENWKQWRAPWGQEVLVSELFRTTTDDKGDFNIYPQGDTSVPASGHMPKSSLFFDTIIRQEPIDDDHLDAEDNLEEFGPVSDEDLAHLSREVKNASKSGRAIIIVLPGMALGDIALVPAPFLKRPKGIRDVSEWYMSTVTRRDYIEQVFCREVAYALVNLRKIHEVIGDTIDAVYLCGTDFGTQKSTFCSKETFLELYSPYYKEMTQWIHQHTSWKVFKHSCGAVGALLDAFIESGFDILNPVQCSAEGMDPEHLNTIYGDRLVFWGGGIDTQKVLPFGSPEQVHEQVLRRCEVFSRGGGYVFNSIHNVQACTPVANIVAMINAVHEFNGRH